MNRNYTATGTLYWDLHVPVRDSDTSEAPLKPRFSLTLPDRPVDTDVVISAVLVPLVILVWAFPETRSLDQGGERL
jgi:hypothetical protein